MKNSIYRDSAVCAAVTGSMTSAMKAQRTLSKHAIRAEVKKLGGTHSKSGCVYGVTFDCTILGNISALLESSGIEVREYLR